MICALDEKDRLEVNEGDLQAAEVQPAEEQPAAETVEAEAPKPVEQLAEAVVEELVAEQAEPAVESEAGEPEEAAEQAATEPTEEPSATEPEEVVVEQAEPAHPTFEIPETEEGIIARMEFLAEHPEQSERLEIVALRKAFYRLHVAETQDEQGEEKTAEEIEAAQETKLLDEMTEKFQSLLKQIKDLRAKLQEDAEQQKQLNAEKRQQIVEKIRIMLGSPETISSNYQAFRALQEDWKAAKPVPQQAQNELWRNYQFVTEQFYDLLKENNALRDYDFKKNLDKKTQLCEETERLAAEIEQAAAEGKLSGNKLIAAVNTLQHMHDAYREVGPVEKSKREDLWNRFKAASSIINRHHAKYFEAAKAQEKENLQKKIQLCEAVETIETEGLRTYNQWTKAAQTIQGLQVEWRTVGRAARKQNQQIYERFRAACDKFFEARSAFFKAQKKEFAENTQKKLKLIEAVEALKDSTDWQATAAEIRKLQQEWKETGHVGHKSSNALWERFNGACNYFFAQMKEANPYGRRGNGPRRAREFVQLTPSEALQKQYQQLKGEILTFETNIAFLTSSSKSGSALIDQMNKRVEGLKKQLAELEKRMKAPEEPASETSQEEAPAE